MDDVAPGKLPRDGRDGLRDGRRAAMVAALNGRASWIMIRQWRRGIEPVPQWAKDLIADKIRDRRRRFEHVELRLRAS